MDANVFASGLCVVGFIHRFLGLVGLRLLLRVIASQGGWVSLLPPLSYGGQVAVLTEK